MSGSGYLLGFLGSGCVVGNVVVVGICFWIILCGYFRI